MVIAVPPGGMYRYYPLLTIYSQSPVFVLQERQNRYNIFSLIHLICTIGGVGD